MKLTDGHVRILTATINDPDHFPKKFVAFHMSNEYYLCDQLEERRLLRRGRSDNMSTEYTITLLGICAVVAYKQLLKELQRRTDLELPMHEPPLDSLYAQFEELDRRVKQLESKHTEED